MLVFLPQSSALTLSLEQLRDCCCGAHIYISFEVVPWQCDRYRLLAFNTLGVVST